MMYDLTLRIAYEYETPVGLSRHLLRVYPRDIPGLQRRIACDLVINPSPSEHSTFTDAFGNLTHDVLLRQDHDIFEIRLKSRIIRSCSPFSDEAGSPVSALAEELSTIRSLGPDSPHHCLGRSSLVRPSKMIGEFARDAVSGTDGVADAVRRFGQALFHTMVFDATATDVHTPHDEAFAQRRGVCQDFTHIMIAGLRGLGVPAGYVSGFLRTLPPEGQARLSGADAMHAWVRAWCGKEVGWIEYDPTNAVDVADQHIVVAYGRDYFDVSPTKGVVRTVGSHDSIQQVDLLEVPQSA